MGKLFGTNGVRGVFSEDFTLEFVHDLVLAISTYFKEGTILVGYDGRYSSNVISKIVCSTLNSAGLDCHLAGLVPTPCLEFATKTLGYNGGIMITASHNPPEYNGIKPVASDGVEISREDEKIIEEIFFKKNWKQNSSTFGSTIDNDRAIQTYLDGIKSQVDVSKIKSQMDQAGVDEKIITQNESIILSMTKKERENPKIIDGSRRKRIANGSGTDVATINKLLKQFKMMSEMMKKMSKGNVKGMTDKGIPPELFNQLK